MLHLQKNNIKKLQIRFVIRTCNWFGEWTISCLYSELFKVKSLWNMHI